MTTTAITPLRQRMIEDINARKLGAGTQRAHIRSCKRFAAFLKRSPETATLEDIRRFQLHLADTGVSICNRNRIMTRRWALSARASNSGSRRRCWAAEETLRLARLGGPDAVTFLRHVVLTQAAAAGGRAVVCRFTYSSRVLRLVTRRRPSFGKK